MATVWLIGMMGSGKSAVGRRLAERRNVAFVDTDDEVEAEAAETIAELWDSQGEDAFRDIEERHVRRLAGREAVVATGGGAVLRPENVEQMRASGTVVWLRAPVDELSRRVGTGTSRPLLSGLSTQERLTALLDERRSLYESAAHHVVETGGRSLDEVVDEVERCTAS